MKILFTGAGFTYNFGAPLANDLWNKLLTHRKVQKHSKLKKELLADFNFESVFDKVLNGSYTQEEKDAIYDAMVDSYHDIDEIVRSYVFSKDSPYPVNIYDVQLKLISRFSGTSASPGFFFTVNQDLFVERHYYNGTRLTIPWVRVDSRWFQPNYSQPINQTDMKVLPTSVEIQSSDGLPKQPFFYIKLHGSSNWVSSGSKNQLVVGRGKLQQIMQEPLLKEYFSLFKTHLLQPNQRILVVGYGFADEHINDVIAEAVSNYGLELFIISPEAPKDLSHKINSQHRGQEIWDGLSGHYKYSLLDIFPSDQSNTATWNHIESTFFDGLKT